eukprot:SAG25_NODE_9291_length_379_cov_0.550000_1_plen_57_part_10
MGVTSTSLRIVSTALRVAACLRDGTHWMSPGDVFHYNSERVWKCIHTHEREGGSCRC